MKMNPDTPVLDLADELEKYEEGMLKPYKRRMPETVVGDDDEMRLITTCNLDATRDLVKRSHTHTDVGERILHYAT
jgi:hypothetical protein